MSMLTVSELYRRVAELSEELKYRGEEKCQLLDEINDLHDTVADLQADNKQLEDRLDTIIEQRDTACCEAERLRNNYNTLLSWYNNTMKRIKLIAEDPFSYFGGKG